MAYHNAYRRKPCLSEHQKQIRFFTGLSVGICTLFAVVFFWLVSRLSFIPH
jgi:hypothetical protein